MTQCGPVISTRISETAPTLGGEYDIEKVFPEYDIERGVPKADQVL